MILFLFIAGVLSSFSRYEQELAHEIAELLLEKQHVSAPVVLEGTCECRGGSGNGNTCGTWDRDGTWCYLKGNLDAKNCPGAIKSRHSNNYWSKEPCTPRTCECRGGSGNGNTCGTWDTDGTWCYLKGGLNANFCPGAIKSRHSNNYWSKEPCTPVVVDKGASGCYGSRRCKVCEGDCDKDSDCEFGLKCFHRTSPSDVVPGCASSGYKASSGYDHDYCYDPTTNAVRYGYWIVKREYPNNGLYAEKTSSKFCGKNSDTFAISLVPSNFCVTRNLGADAHAVINQDKKIVDVGYYCVNQVLTEDITLTSSFEESLDCAPKMEKELSAELAEELDLAEYENEDFENEELVGILGKLVGGIGKLFQSSSFDDNCQCRGNNGFGEYCKPNGETWDSDGNWCYLKGGASAKSCPGATITRGGGGEVYWSRDPCTCECRGGSGKGSTCGAWDSDGTWCYLKGNLNAKNCPGAIKSRHSNNYWSTDPCTQSVKDVAKDLLAKLIDRFPEDN